MGSIPDSDCQVTEQCVLYSTLDAYQRLQRQIAAIESGVDPVFVGERIRALKAERQQAERVLSELDQQHQRPSVDLEGACTILDGLPDRPSPSPERSRSFNDASSRSST